MAEREAALPKGQLIRRRDGWAGRYYVTIDGVRVRRYVPLGTDVRAVAAAKLARLIAGDAPPEVAAQAERFRDAAERVHERRRAGGVRSAADEVARLRAYAYPTLGDLPVTAVRHTDINQALDACQAAGRSRQTVAHLKQAIRGVFEALLREGSVTDNPTAKAKLPTFRETVRKERSVITDAELGAYLGYVHPQERWRNAILERQVMACVARMFGGLRTGDLHSLKWEAFDVGEFAHGWAPRRKTRRPQLLGVPELLRPILRDWWERHGRPQTGLVFPARRGARAGQEKTKVSQAQAFRRDLMRAFGIEVWDPERQRFEAVRELTARERELFEESEFTLPVDFHSWRRAFSQALADADVTAQQAQALAGHSTLAAHALYLASSGRMRHVPTAALPNFTRAQAVPSGGSDLAKSAMMLPGSARHASGAACGLVPFNDFVPVGLPRANDSKGRQQSGLCPDAVPVHARAADAALRAYLHAYAARLAAEVAS